MADKIASSFTHRSQPEWTFDPNRTYEQRKTWCKPVGLWLSVDGDWERWLTDEGMADDPSWGVVTTEFSVDLDRCLHLASVEDIDRFDAEYVVPNTPTRNDGHPDRYRIDWAPLAERFAGIVIAPYQWERRLQGAASTWYCPWDVASACVWDLSAVRCTSPEVSGE